MIGWLLDFLWPRSCEICGGAVDRPHGCVCSSCQMRLPFVPVQGCCRKCGRDVPELDQEFLCDDCREHQPDFDRVASVLKFEGDAREMVNAFKFRNHHWLRDDFAEWLEGSVRARFKIGEIDLVVPVPTTFWHRYDRGYNQCDYLAKALAKRLNLPYGPRVLARCGKPERQGGLDEEGRRLNVIDTFAVRLPDMVKGKTVLVVDDIMTTGSTLSEIARMLKLSGSNRVWAVTLARSFRMR